MAANQPTMKAEVFHTFGGPEVLQLEEVPRPRPKAGEVLVRVHAAGVNPIDWKVRAGHMRGARNIQPPLIPGWDLSGVVESGDGEWKAGAEVFTRPNTGRDGCYAEYVAVSASELAAKPKRLDHVHAAAIPLAGLTAWQAVEAAEAGPGKTVLIHGGAGGVGSFATQFAKLKGARVIATVEERDLDYVRGMGADQAVDYRKERFEEAAGKVDAVIDLIGGETQKRSWAVVKRGGVLVSTVGISSPELGETRGVRQVALVAQTRPDQLARMAALADAGKLQVPVETVLPLSAAREAQILSESGHVRGKIVLKVA